MLLSKLVSYKPPLLPATMKKLRLCITVVALILSFCAHAAAQHRTDTSQPRSSVGVNLFYGFFIANQPKSLYLRDDHSRLIELNYFLPTTGRRQWEAESNFPRVGVGLLHGSTGSRQYLGTVTALYPFIHFPLLRTLRSETSFKLGAGFGWVQKPYNKETNYKNLMIGTHINAVIAMRMESEWAISSHLFVNVGLAFTHLSNGGIRLPNLGLNIPALSVGARLATQSSQFAKRHSAGLLSLKKTSLYLHANFALKQVYPLESSLKPVYILIAELNRTLSNVSTISGGLNLSYDKSLFKEVVNAPTYIFNKDEPQLQASIYGGYEQVTGRLSIPVQFGVYIYNKYAISTVYQMIGIRYKVSAKWTASVQLKTHFGKADYIQYGIGYKIF